MTKEEAAEMLEERKGEVKKAEIIEFAKVKKHTKKQSERERREFDEQERKEIM